MTGSSTGPAAIADAIERLVEERGPEKTVCPSEVARAIAGSDETAWRLLMKPIRAQAVLLAEAGRITIRRKGRVVDPAAFRGVYRLGAPAGEGNSASVRPERR